MHMLYICTYITLYISLYSILYYTVYTYYNPVIYTYTILYIGILVDDIYPSPYLPVTTYIPDTTPPAVLAFHLNNTLNILTIYFNDILYIHNPLIDIVLSSINLISNYGVSSPMSQATLLTQYNSNNITINIYNIRTHLNALIIGYLQSTTFLYISQKGGVVDDSPARNPINKMLVINPVSILLTCV